jgi:hypothetical protein
MTVDPAKTLKDVEAELEQAKVRSDELDKKIAAAEAEHARPPEPINNGGVI